MREVQRFVFETSDGRPIYGNGKGRYSVGPSESCLRVADSTTDSPESRERRRATIAGKVGVSVVIVLAGTAKLIDI